MIILIRKPVSDSSHANYKNNCFFYKKYLIYIDFKSERIKVLKLQI